MQSSVTHKRIESYMRTLFRTLQASGLIAALLALSLPATLPASADEAIAAGTEFQAALESQDINTKNAQIGDGFTLKIVPPYPADDTNFAGARLRGHVADVQSAGQGRPARLVLRLDSIVFPDGESQRISGSVSTTVAKPDNTTARKALGAGAGAAVGSQTVGRILGGALGSVVGLVGGAAAGYAYAKNNRPNLSLSHGVVTTATSWSDIEVPRRQAPE